MVIWNMEVEADGSILSFRCKYVRIYRTVREGIQEKLTGFSDLGFMVKKAGRVYDSPAQKGGNENVSCFNNCACFLFTPDYL